MAAPPPSPFGIILPSRPVHTDPIAISSTQYAFTLPSSPPFSHIVVFLLPGTALPPSTLAGVYIQLPSAPPGFKLLGALGNEKQSAIFKVGPQGQKHTQHANGVVSIAEEGDEMIDVVDNEPGGQDITIGISIEPAATLTGQLAAISSTQPLSSSALVVARYPPPVTAISTKVLAQRIIKNAFNFLASFAGTTDVGTEEVVPLRSFRDWWIKFERRVENEPGFLERDGDG